MKNKTDIVFLKPLGKTKCAIERKFIRFRVIYKYGRFDSRFLKLPERHVVTQSKRKFQTHMQSACQDI